MIVYSQYTKIIPSDTPTSRQSIFSIHGWRPDLLEGVDADGLLSENERICVVNDWIYTFKTSRITKEHHLGYKSNLRLQWVRLFARL